VNAKHPTVNRSRTLNGELDRLSLEPIRKSEYEDEFDSGAKTIGDKRKRVLKAAERQTLSAERRTFKR
jgi:hypothetical protein